MYYLSTQETGDVEFKSVDFDFSDIAPLTINTDGSVVTIDGEKVQTDLIRFRNNIVETTLILYDLAIRLPNIPKM